MSITGEQCGSSWGGGAGPLGMQIRCICTVFAHFEALSLDSQSLKVIPAWYLPCEITLRSSDRSRSADPPWESFRTSRRPSGDPQRTPRKLQKASETSQEALRNPQEASGSSQGAPEKLSGSSQEARGDQLYIITSFGSETPDSSPLATRMLIE